MKYAKKEIHQNKKKTKGKCLRTDGLKARKIMGNKYRGQREKVVRGRERERRSNTKMERDQSKEKGEQREMKMKGSFYGRAQKRKKRGIKEFIKFREERGERW